MTRRLAVLGLLGCLLAPPLAHNHGGQSAVAGPSSSATDVAAHLQAATAMRGRSCPACAAGPTTVAVAATSRALAAETCQGPCTPAAVDQRTSEAPPARRSRAPPDLPAV